MIIINTPHNPTGSILESEDLEVLYQIVKERNILVLSDEVYEHLIYDGKKHASVLSHAGLYQQSIVVFSFGKTFHCTGWKLGYAIAPERIMQEFRKVHQFNVFSVNSYAQYGLADYLSNPESYEYLDTFYQKKRDILSSYIDDSKLDLIPSRGTYYVLADYSAISDKDDIDFSIHFTKEDGLATIPISVFYTSRRQDRLVRLCFAKTEETLHAAGRILLQL